MTETFNLSKFFKEAMGYANVRYRSQSGGEYMWFDLDTIKHGRNPAWERWKTINPTLATVETEAISFDNGYMRSFQNRYGLTPREIRNFFKVWIGYNPNWGAYINSIGPYRYMGNASSPEKDQQYQNIDQKNRFCFFTKRFQKADEATVMNSYVSYVNDNLAEYKQIMAPEDFDFDLKIANGLKDNGKINWNTITLPLDSPDMHQIYENDPFMGAGTQININGKGIAKIIREMTREPTMQGYLTHSINTVAFQKGLNAEAITAAVQGDDSALENSNKVLRLVMEELQKFFPVLLRQKSVSEGWEDILNEAVQLTGEDLPAGYPTTPEDIWAMLSEINEVPAAALTAEQKARNIMKNKMVSTLTKQITTVIKKRKKQNEIKEKSWGSRPADTPEVKAQKTRELERLNAIKLLPTTASLGKKTSGAQLPTALTVRTSQKSLLNLKKEILEYLAGQDPTQPINAEEVARQMTESRSGSTSKALGKEWTAADVNMWIERITEEMNDPHGERKTFAQLLGQTEGEIAEMNDIEVKGSYTDFDTACRMASIYFMSANAEDIDPGTRAVKNVDYRSPPPLFQRDPGAPNVSSTKLTQLRSTRPAETEDEESEDMDIATQADIETQIGEAPIPPTTSTPSAPEQPATQPAPTQQEEWQPAIDDIEIMDFGDEGQGIPKTMKNTLNSLIKIAEELDLEGKSGEAEEIHLLIRKYLG